MMDSMGWPYESSDCLSHLQCTVNPSKTYSVLIRLLFFIYHTRKIYSSIGGYETSIAVKGCCGKFFLEKSDHA